MSVNVYELVARIVEAKVANLSSDVRQEVFTAIEQANSTVPEMLVDAINLADTLGQFIGAHYARVSGTNATDLARKIVEDIRFLGITQGGDQ